MKKRPHNLLLSLHRSRCRVSMSFKTIIMVLATGIMFWSIPQNGLANLQGESITISGMITDNQGEPVPGASVVVKDTSDGTVSDMDGRYTLSGVPSGGTLVVSFIGMRTQEIPVNGQRNINITMEEEEIGLDEVVVVGYGVQRKSDITGAISSVNEEQMMKIPTTDIGQMLVGRVAGLEVIPATGRPGEFSDIRIRGTRSLSGGNNPLYVVDGVPVEDINFINPADIASMEVLKDASSTAIYGARAANGVVLVTTKRGKEGKTNISVSATHTTQMLKRNFDFYTPEGYVALQREKYRQEDGSYPSDDVIFPTYELDNLANQNYTDWEELAIDNARLQRYDVSMTTGTEKSQMLLSFGFFDQDGMISNSAYQQFNTRLNADYEMYDNLSVGANFSYTYSDRDIEEEFIEGYLGMSPLSSPYDENGELVQVVGDGGQNNPLWNNKEYFHNEKQHQYLVNVFADWKILPNLTYRLNTSLNGRFGSNEVYRSSLHQIGSNTDGTGNLSEPRRIDILVENILKYNLETDRFGKLDLTLLQSANQLRNETLSVGATNFPTDMFGANGIGGALEPGQPSMNISDRKIQSFMGRANYNLQDKYMLSFTMRADGSSVFGENNKWAYLPSFAAGWLLHREDFMADLTWLSNAKLRFSYGQVGNQAVSPYRTLGVVNEYFYKFGNNDPSYAALPSGELYNPNLKWEVSESQNFGLELGVFENRLTLDAEMYVTNTKDLIVNRSIDASLGYTRMYDNLGEVRNKGFELSVNYDVLRNREFNWNVNLNYSQNRNEIIKINGELDEEGNPIDDVNNNWFIGEPVNVYHDYKFDGIWQEDDDIANSYMPDAKPGDIRVADIDENGEIDSDDKIIYERDPKFIASFTSEMEFKGFDLSLDFFWRYGGYRYNSNYGGGLGGGSSNAMDVGYWTPENPSNTMPRPQLSYIYNISTIQYQDASYFRLRNATLGYSLPQTILERVGISNLRVFTSLTNFWTVTDYLSYGPEHGAGSYPEPKTVQFGVNLNF
ncbi:SusC/RagA family TonB-linked outer membrane protein [Marinilabilia salmonicolor]|uniref:SusC/RagA family TonB-linked outer membrane protein n=2 Tax=Marinilabilia salmonicolor TaxID=989 RepID=UPI0009D95A13|nr:TonB-dependent receptor [Marinilabilia salmonicolor]